MDIDLIGEEIPEIVEESDHEIKDLEEDEEDEEYNQNEGEIP